MEGVKLAIFDMDGLMIDTERLFIEAYEKAAAEMGLKVNKQCFLNTIGCNYKDTIIIMKKELGEEFPLDAFFAAGDRVLEEMIAKDGIPKKEGLAELLDYLDSKGIKKVVATSTSRDRAIERLKAAAILDRFDDITCGDEIERGKPEPDIFLKACEKMGISPRESIVLEDSMKGLEAASRANIRCILVPDLIEPTKDQEALAFKRVKSLLEVIKIKFA